MKHIKLRHLSSYLFAFLLPIIFFFLACQLQKGGIWPFGENTIVTNDAEGQYVPFFSYLKSIFFDNNDFLYSFNNILGGDFFGFAAYYLFSPFNLIYLIITSETTAFLVVTLLKIGAIGLTAFIFLTKHFKIAPQPKTVIFSTAYALMLYNAAFSANTMFLDGVIWLPLIFLGIDKLLMNGKTRLYVLSLAAILCIQYYMAYIICIGAVLYFIYSFLLQNWGEIKKHLFQIRRFLFSSILAALIAAAIILPTFISLQSAQRYVTPTDDFVETMIHFSWTDAPLQFLGFIQGRANAVYGPPFIFCGIITALFVILFFTTRRIRPREKILSAAFIAFFLLSFATQPLDYAWHAFSTPNGFSFRYAFILVLFLVMLAYKYFLKIESSNFFQNRLSTLTLGVFNTASLFVMATFVIFNSVTDGAHEFKLHEEVNYNIQNISYPISLARAADPSMYRLEKDFQYTENDPMLFGYNGLTHYSSSVQSKTVSFLAKLDFSRVERVSLAVAYKNDHTMAIDSFFGVKYILVTNESENYVDYESEFFENTYALPMGFMADQNLLQADLENLNYFEVQNQIFRSLSGLDKPIFTPTEIAVETQNLKAQTLPDGGTEYTAAQPNVAGNLLVTAPVDDDNLYYLDLKHTKSQNLSAKLDNEDIKFAYDTGDGQNLNPPILLNRKWALLTENPQLEVAVPANVTLNSAAFWQENKAALGEHYTALADEPCDLQKITSSHLTCTVEAQAAGNLFFTIPNDEGWAVKVDGKKVPTQTAFDLFMTIPLSAGVHNIELKYTPRGLPAGIFISLATLLVCAIYSIKKFWRHSFRLLAVSALHSKNPSVRRASHKAKN